MSVTGQSRILVVDDNRVNRLILQEKILGCGYLVSAAASGRESLDLLSGEGRFDMVLLDVMMPEMDGLEVLRRIREKVRAIELPVIMVTVNDKSRDVVEALEAGANDYVTKPIDYDVLFVRMGTHLELKSMHRSLRESQMSLIRAAKMESVSYLAAGLAHEIRNPLAQIQMAGRALRRCVGEGNEKAGSLIDGIGTSIERADEIVAELQKASRSKSLKLVSRELAPQILEVLELLDPQLEGQSVRPVLELEAEAIAAMCSRPELRQIIFNVALNGVQAMADGGQLTIRVFETVADRVERSQGARSAAGIRPGGKIAVIEINDTGTGVQESDLPRVFDPFFTTRATGTGTGLGLTVARNLIELQGGLIEIRNRQACSGLSVRLLLQNSRLPMI
jgi:signal transduction histidine kinase